MSSTGSSIDSSFQFNVATPSDTATLTYTNVDGVVEQKMCKAIYIGGAGNLTIKNDAGDNILFTGVTAGSILPISTVQIMSTGTTATPLCVLF